MCKIVKFGNWVAAFCAGFVFLFVACSKDPVSAGTGNVTPPPPQVETEVAKAIVLFIEKDDAIGSVDLKVYNADLGLKWSKINIGTGVIATPVVTNDIIYVAASHFEFVGSSYISHNNFYALDINTGAEKWSKLQSPQMITGMQARNDTVYVTSSRNNIKMLQAYNANTGAMLWEKTTGDQYDAFNPFLDGNILFYCTSKSNTVSYLAALDINTKQKTWEIPMSANVGNTPSKIAMLGNQLFIMNGVTQLMAVSKTSGSVIWSKQATHPVVADNMLYYADADGLHRTDPANGNIIWTYKKPGSPLYAAGAPFIANGNIYFSGTDIESSFVLSANNQTGAVNWRTSTSLSYEKPITVGKNMYLLQEPKLPGSKLMILSSETGLPKDSLAPGRIDGPYGIVTGKGEFRFNVKEAF